MLLFTLLGVDYSNAGWSSLAMIPFMGDVGKAAKYGDEAAALAKKVLQTEGIH